MFLFFFLAFVNAHNKVGVTAAEFCYTSYDEFTVIMIVRRQYFDAAD